MRPVARLPLDSRGRADGPGGVPAALRALDAALRGAGPALAPAPPGAGVAPREVADDVALLLPTSGSGGRPRLVELGAAALLASAAAGVRRLGGPGGWLLALPLSHVAGWQVLTRCLLAGTDPLPVDAPGSAWPASFAAAAGAPRQGALRRYAALVPTQLARLLELPAAAAAASLDAVLLGGAATPAPLAARAAAAGVRVVAGYGMTETSGGCVYDGVPLDGVDARVDAAGRIHLAGPVLARGYHGADPATGFRTLGGRRWFATADAGRLDGDRLHVLGRLDDTIVTGGEKVQPAAVEAVLAELDGVREVLVVGVADAEWGQRVVALVVAAEPAPPAEAVRGAVRDRLGAAAVPREVLLVDDLPRRALGKPDRRAAAALAAHRTALGRAGAAGAADAGSPPAAGRTLAP